MTSIEGVHLRQATSADAAAMAQCRLADSTDEGLADSRMAAYFDGQHHPQKALLPRVGYLALRNSAVIGYIAGHLTTRNGCSGEVQYLFVQPAYRRQGVATAMLRLLAQWFDRQGAHKVCVPVAADSHPEARPFCERVGASPLKKHWFAWEDIGTMQRHRKSTHSL